MGTAREIPFESAPTALSEGERAASYAVGVVRGHNGELEAKFRGYSFTLEREHHPRYWWRCAVETCPSRLATMLLTVEHSMLKFKNHDEAEHRKNSEDTQKKNARKRRYDAVFRNQPARKIGDFRYVLKKEADNLQYWRCEYAGCPGRCCTENSFRVVAGPTHHLQELHVDMDQRHSVASRETELCNDAGTSTAMQLDRVITDQGTRAGIEVATQEASREARAPRQQKQEEEKREKKRKLHHEEEHVRELAEQQPDRRFGSLSNSPPVHKRHKSDKHNKQHLESVSKQSVIDSTDAEPRVSPDRLFEEKPPHPPPQEAAVTHEVSDARCCNGDLKTQRSGIVHAGSPETPLDKKGGPHLRPDRALNCAAKSADDNKTQRSGIVLAGYPGKLLAKGGSPLRTDSPLKCATESADDNKTQRSGIVLAVFPGELLAKGGSPLRTDHPLKCATESADDNKTQRSGIVLAGFPGELLAKGSSPLRTDRPLKRATESADDNKTQRSGIVLVGFPGELLAKGGSPVRTDRPLKCATESADDNKTQRSGIVLAGPPGMSLAIGGSLMSPDSPRNEPTSIPPRKLCEAASAVKKEKEAESPDCKDSSVFESDDDRSTVSFEDDDNNVDEECTLCTQAVGNNEEKAVKRRAEVKVEGEGRNAAGNLEARAHVCAEYERNRVLEAEQKSFQANNEARGVCDVDGNGPGTSAIHAGENRNNDNDKRSHKSAGRFRADSRGPEPSVSYREHRAELLRMAGATCDSRERELRVAVLMRMRRLLEAETELANQERRTEAIRRMLLQRQLMWIISNMEPYMPFR